LKKISILGYGNVACILGTKLQASGFFVDKVWGRDATKARAFATSIKAGVANDVSELAASDIVIIAVSDAAIQRVSDLLPETDALVVHTSGMIEMDLLKQHKRRGVFYPLQTLTKDFLVPFTEVPFLLESKQADDMALLKELASGMGSTCYEMNSDIRKHVHLSAVFVNNFANHLFSIASNLLQEKQLPLEILHPLMRQTVDKAIALSPQDIQTGPAKRGDIDTINQHLALLSKYPEYNKIYEVLSESIRNRYKN
jgi:predicted short-subunit dehydrogenase-like oxidoreductase (DUF2520 family)